MYLIIQKIKFEGIKGENNNRTQNGKEEQGHIKKAS